MSETRLGITLAGRNELTPVIDAAKAQLRGLEQELENITNKTGRWAKMTQADLVAMTGVIKANIAQVRAELRGLETQLAAASSVSQVSLGSTQSYEARIQELRKLETGLMSATTAQERLTSAERSAARAIAEGAAARGIPALQAGYQATGRRELIESPRDERGRFISGQGSGTFAAAIVGAEADLAKAQAMVRIRQESAEAIALEKRALSEKVTGLAEELRLSQEAAELKAATNQKLMNDAAAVHATDARLRAERLSGLEEEKRLGVEAAELKGQTYKKIADDAARVTAAEIVAQSKTALSTAAIRQMPIVGRIRLWGADEATREAAGLDFYANASARVRTAIENTANSTTRARNAISEFHRDLSHAGGNIDQTTYAVRKLITVLDETARGQSGQRISTIGSAIRDLGVGRALPIIAPIAVGLAAVEVSHLVSEYSKLATKTDDAARAAGVGVEEYSRLARVLQLAGVSAERLPTAMGQLSQSIRTAITEPLSTKGTAFAEIFGKGFFTDLPKFEEEPLKTENIDKLRQKYQELARTMGEFQAMGAFRTALGRTEWVELAPLITAAETEYQKWNKAVADSHLPFTSGEIEKLREVDFATKKLVEDWEYLGKATALFAGNTGLITFIDSVVLKLGALARNSREAAIGFESIGVGIVVGGLAGIPGGPIGMAAGAAAGAIAGGVGGAKIAEATREGTGPRPGPEPGSVIVSVPPKPWAPISTPSEASTREGVSRQAHIPTAKSDDERSRYPQLYGFGGAKIAPESLVSEAVKYREEIEQTHRVIEARLDAEKTEALGRARSETDRQRIEEDFSRREAANRAKAVQEERDMLSLYRQRMQDVPEATRPLAEKDLGRRVGVQIEVEEFNTRKKLAQEEERFRREEFRVYDEEKRLELQLAKGNAAQEEQIFQERLQAAKQAFGEESLEFKRLQLEHVQAAQAATKEMLQDRLRIQDTIGRVSAAETRITAAGMESQEIGQTIGKRVDHTEAYRAEQVLIQQTAASQVEAYQAIAAAAGENAEIKIQALDRAALAAENAASQEVQLAHKISEEMHRAAEESSKVFVQFFDKTGGAFETFIDDAVFRTKTWQQATRDLLLGIDKDLLHTAEKLGSQFAAQGLAKSFGVELAPGKGIGDLLGQMAGKALGLAPNAEDKQALMQSLLQTANAQRTTATGILSQIRDAAVAQAQKVGTIQAGAGIPRTAETLPGVKIPGVDWDTIPSSGGPASNALVAAKAQQYGLNPNFANAVADIESSHGANVGDTRKSQYAGNVFQVGPEERRMLGTPGMGTTEEQVDYGVRLLVQRRNELSEKLGREVTNSEIYLAHQQGVSGAAALITHPGVPAGQLVPPQNISANMGDPSASAREFTDMWRRKVESRENVYAGMPQQTAQSVQQLGTAATTTAQALVKIPQAVRTEIASHAAVEPTVERESSTVPHRALSEYGITSTTRPPDDLLMSQGFAYGGPVHGFQHGGIGTDTIPAMLTPGEFVVKNSAVGHYGVDFLHSINNMALPKGFAQGGSVSYFAFGGINTPPPLPNSPQPYKGSGSPMTTPTISGGITTESRGFLSPTLYTVFPKPNLGGLLAILGIGAAGLAGAIGLEKILSSDEKKKSERLLAAKETVGGWTGQGIPDKLSEDVLRNLSTSQISGLPDDVSGLCGGGVAGYREGGKIPEEQFGAYERMTPAFIRTMRRGSSEIDREMQIDPAYSKTKDLIENYGRTLRFPSLTDKSEEFHFGGAVKNFQEGGIVAGMLQEQVESQGSIFPPSDTYSPPSLFSSSAPPGIAGSIDPRLASLPGTMANELYQAQIQKGMNIGLNFGSGSMKFSRMETKDASHIFDRPAEHIKMYAEGQEDYIASATVIQNLLDPSKAKIEVMQSFLAAKYPMKSSDFAAGIGKGSLGPKFIRDAAREYFLSHPDITELSGMRVSGARERAGTEDWATMYRDSILKPGFQEGGVANQESEFQLAGDVIQFSGRSRAPKLPDPMEALKLRLKVAESQGDWATVREIESSIAGLEQFRLPKFHTGGKASNEVIARLLTNERVLSPDETKAYDSLPKFHSGGYVWPAFAEGGMTSDEGMVGGGQGYASTRGGSSSSDARAVYSSISGLSSSMSVLSSDVEKVAGGFKSLERVTGPTTQTTGRLSSELSAVGSALGTFKGILSSFSSMGSGGGGVGGAAGGIGGIFSLFGTIGTLFGLQKGGLREVTGSGGTDSQLVQFMATPGEMVNVVTPEQHRASMVGGLPHFATGGTLTVGEKGIAPAISQFVQGTATQITGGPGTAGGVNVSIGSINGVMNAHDVRRMLVNEFSSISRAFQRGARNNFDLPGR